MAKETGGTLPSTSSRPTSPDVEVTVITYRRPQTLGRTIQSLLDQTYPHFAVHVYDDASGDETGTVVRDFMSRDPRVHYFCQPVNLGCFPNHNFALSRVTAPFFVIASDDDYFHPDFLANALAEFNLYPESDAVSMVTHIVDKAEKQISDLAINKLMEGFHRPPGGLIRMLEIGCLCWTGMVFRRECLSQVGLLTLSQNFANDLDYLVRVCAQKSITVSTKEGAYFTVHGGGFSSISKLDWLWPGYLDTIQFVADHAELSASTRQRCVQLLLDRLRARLLYTFLGAVQNCRMEEADVIIKIFIDYFGWKHSAYILKGLARLRVEMPAPSLWLLQNLERNKPYMVRALEYLGNLKRAKSKRIIGKS